MTRIFSQLLKAQWEKGHFVCVGLDSELGKIPEIVHCRNRAVSERPVVAGETIARFNQRIVDATKDLVCAYKPNLAFYLAHGHEGVEALAKTISTINMVAPDVPVILDAKFGDIGNTNAGYVQFAFGYLGADAVTVQPYLGQEATRPFLDCKDKGIFVLCRTSNQDSGEFQDFGQGDEPLYQFVARRVASKRETTTLVTGGWNTNENCGLVVGATYPGQLSEVREIVDDMPILIPGIGTQGGDVEKTVAAGKDSRGQGMIINSSRGIIFASNGADFADAARRETLKLTGTIRQCL